MPAEVIRRQRESHPSDARLHYNLAVALRSLGRTDEALRERQRAISLDPEAAKWSF